MNNQMSKFLFIPFLLFLCMFQHLPAMENIAAFVKESSKQFEQCPWYVQVPTGLIACYAFNKSCDCAWSLLFGKREPEVIERVVGVPCGNDETIEIIQERVKTLEEIIENIKKENPRLSIDDERFKRFEKRVDRTYKIVYRLSKEKEQEPNKIKRSSITSTDEHYKGVGTPHVSPFETPDLTPDGSPRATSLIITSGEKEK